MNKKIINEKICGLIKQSELLRNAESITEDSLLYEEYGLDSASVIELVVMIEEEFGFEFEATALNLKNFTTVSKISDYITSKLDV
jgi:acyl carrier protein